ADAAQLRVDWDPAEASAAGLDAADTGGAVSWDSAEADSQAEYDEPSTIQALQQVLERTGCVVTVLPADRDLPLRLLQTPPDLVFNIAEGQNGRSREAQVPALLEYLGIPFSGSDATTLALALDKTLSKHLLTSQGIRTPQSVLIEATNPDWSALAELTLPVIVKPNSEGSSKGIGETAVVQEPGELQRLLTAHLRRAGQPLLVEEYIAGREFTVGLLGNGTELRVFPPMEVIFSDPAHPIYSYEVKRDFRRYIRYACPPDIPAPLQAELQETAQAVFELFGCRDLARLDFRVDAAGVAWCIEVNPLPGLAPDYSDYPMLAGFSGLDYEHLIWSILNSALLRYDFAPLDLSGGANGDQE
ncbi:MAG: ATP-grasp domain-containing protein, partial [Actinomycetia bacterium]|nr:ATP-grasp domain-containing protein [Actinomycetes bacterium]